MPSALPQPAYWRPFVFAEEPTEASLKSMGFDIHRLGFYAWLVAHGREPLIDGTAQVSTARYGAAVTR